ncbi:entericidin A/B family lipoprotein [Litchfieldella xinjiangensis]|nr:entericidin A/B family lipoprotein [Halomonas xinjiangensis]
MKRIQALVGILLVSLLVLSGCNTIRGAGEDIERGGEAVQDASS